MGWRSVWTVVNARDLHLYGGLLLAAVGGWQVSWPATCVAVGLVLTVLGVFAGRINRLNRGA